MRVRVMVLILVVTGMFSAMATLPALALQSDRPDWTRAALTVEDVGPGFERAGERMTIGEGIAGYQVILVRPAEMTPDRHSAVGTLLLRMDGGLTPGDFDWVATRLASGQAGFQEEQGPHVGEETRWFVGPWPPQNPAEESRVVVVHHGEYVLSIVVGGPMGTAGQDRVMSYASTVIDRLQRLGPEART